MRFDLTQQCVVGDCGSLPVAKKDEVARYFLMLIEGQCELGPKLAAEKYGVTRQWYTRVRTKFLEGGATGMLSKTRGPKRNYRRTDEVVRQIIRYRFLDPECTIDVVAQKLRQTSFKISTRSVERVISEYGLQKKDCTHADQKSMRRPLMSKRR